MLSINLFLCTGNEIPEELMGCRAAFLWVSRAAVRGPQVAPN